MSAFQNPCEYNPPTISFDLMEMIGNEVAYKREADKILDNYSKVLVEMIWATEDMCGHDNSLQYFNEIPMRDEDLDFWCPEYEKQDNQLLNSLNKET